MSVHSNSPRVRTVSGSRVVTDNGWEAGFDGEYWTASHPQKGPFREHGELAVYRSLDGLLRWLLPDAGTAAQGRTV
jgi:hypothetical protein